MIIVQCMASVKGTVKGSIKIFAGGPEKELFGRC